MPRVLITGVAGFIGGACAREFIARGWEVVGLVHRREPNDLGHVEFARGSICDAPTMTGILAVHGPFDAVVHCAGRASDVGRDREFRAANYEGVLNLIECVRGSERARLVHVSTTDVYGLHDFDDADETTPFDDRARNPYPKYKILAERALAERLSPERYATLRPAAVWGAGDTTILPRVINFLRRSPRIIHFGKWRGRNRWPLAHVDNVARAAFLAATRDEARGEAYNVIDPERTTIDEYYRLILAALSPEKAKLKSVTLPFAAGWLAGAASTLLSNALNRDHPLFDPSLYSLYSVSRNLDFSGEKLRRLFDRNGIEFVSREEGLNELRNSA